ncbi:hypothetical protein BKI52_04145 [marine bacterium AO1-C]|nr:hypothetical protein BKI52_04145 [marine bacterium AO1-C]
MKSLRSWIVGLYGMLLLGCNTTLQTVEEKQYNFKVFADYHTIYLTNGNKNEAVFNPDKITDTGIKNRFDIVSKRAVLLYTARNIEVPLQVIVVKKQPQLNLDNWDHVNRCGIQISSNHFLILGGTDGIKEAKSIALPNGYYGMLLGYQGLKTLSKDGLDGKDKYTIYLWPTQQYFQEQILKQ